MTRRCLPLMTATMLGLFLFAAPARADVILTPFLGLTFGGDSQNENLAFGGSLTFMGGGIFGVEVDAMWAPEILDTGDEDFDIDLGDNKVTTIMANIILGAPMGEPGIRPYVAAGAGLLRFSSDGVTDAFDIDEDGWGVSVGAGVMGFVNERFGFRADLRYFRRLEDQDENSIIDLDLGDFNFWRGTIGASFRF